MNEIKCPFCGEMTNTFSMVLHGECAARFKERAKYLKHTTLFLYLDYLHQNGTINLELAQHLVFIAQSKVDLGYHFGWYGADYPRSLNLTNDFVEMTDEIEDYRNLVHIDVKLVEDARTKLDKLQPILRRDFSYERVRKVINQILGITEKSASDDDVTRAVNNLILSQNSPKEEDIEVMNQKLKKYELPNCGKCIHGFWVRVNRGADLECWRHPPKDHVVDGKVLTYAPEVKKKHSCGEGEWFIDGQRRPLSYSEILALLESKKEEKPDNSWEWKTKLEDIPGVNSAEVKNSDGSQKKNLFTEEERLLIFQLVFYLHFNYFDALTCLNDGVAKSLMDFYFSYMDKTSQNLSPESVENIQRFFDYKDIKQEEK